MLRGCRISLVEAVVLAAIVARLCGLLLPDSSTRTRWNIEGRVRDWRPAAVRPPSDASLLSGDARLAGQWNQRRHRCGSRLVFSPRPDGQFDAQFSTWGCLGSAAFARVASVDQGVVALDGAVSEYAGGVYDTLFAVRIAGRDYLLSASDVDRFDRHRREEPDRLPSYLFARGEAADEPSPAP